MNTYYTDNKYDHTISYGAIELKRQIDHNTIISFYLTLLAIALLFFLFWWSYRFNGR